jgi:hypothetical protein
MAGSRGSILRPGCVRVSCSTPCHDSSSSPSSAALG